ncbi:MAG: type I-E CRISPR-associated protein Cas5/CasD [Gammaproteobacteria bacterium]|nr:type I-E CRISPR-associated protein Cas5/CasD [Gammaproteobacteria bacterium]
MTEYIIFALVAPMGSFGEVAGHEWRGSNRWPSRSAILGLVGAALGVHRKDTQGQQSLRKWSYAVSVLSNNYPFQDFHTIQTIPSANIKRPATRRIALEALKSNDNATLTRREYRSDCAFGIALWGGENIYVVAKALNLPCFTTYLGRKSCPLSAPMNAKVVESKTPQEAMKHIIFPPWMNSSIQPSIIISDEFIPGSWQESFWDDPIDRQLWHFAQHQVYIAGYGE